VIKRSRARHVVRCPADGAGARQVAVYVKRYLTDTLGDTLRFTAWRSRAHQEYRNLKALRALGVPAVEPLAWGERRRWGVVTEAVLVTRAVSAREPLHAALPRMAPASRRRALEALGATLARVHAAGFQHRDLHAGNALVPSVGAPAVPEGTAPPVVLVDVQKMVRRGAPLSAARCVLDLGVLDASLGHRVSDDERAGLLAGYLRESGGGSPAALSERVARAVARRRRARLVRHGRRCVRPCAGFRVERLPGGRRLLRRADIEGRAILAAVDRHRALRDAGEGTPGLIKQDRSTAVTRVEEVTGGPPAGRPPSLYDRGCGLAEPGAPALAHVAVKELRSRGVLRSLAHIVERHRGMAAWRGAHALLLRGFDTPAPLALLEERRFGVPYRSFVLTRWETGAEDMPLYIDRRFAANLREPVTGRARGTWELGGERRPMRHGAEARAVRAFGLHVGRLHAQGLYHADLKPPNIMVREERDPDDPAEGAASESAFAFLLIDLESLHLSRRLTWRRRVKNLGQLADWVTSFQPQVKRTHLVRFLRAYLRADPNVAPELRHLVRDVRAMVAAKRARRVRLGYPAVRREVRR
jgi:tRNA A-37 threonylcarbamoyl transferase component Bud32